MFADVWKWKCKIQPCQISTNKSTQVTSHTPHTTFEQTTHAHSISKSFTINTNNIMSPSVSFSDEVVSEVFFIPRMEKESIGDYFYSQRDIQRFQIIWENAYLELSRRKQQQKLQEHDSKQSRANMDADENDRLIVSKRKRSPSPDSIRTLWLAQYSMTVVNQTQSTSTFMSFHSTYRQIRTITTTINKLCYDDRFFVYFNVCFSEQENYAWKKRPLAWFVVSLGPFYVVAA